MLRNIYVHLGTHKTGTTALQQYLNHNRQVLKSAGWLYPETGISKGLKGHHDIAWWLSGKREFDPRSLGEEIVASGCRNVVLSSEEFGVSKNLAQLKTLFEDASVHAVVYFRRQDDYVLSAYNQNVKQARYWKDFSVFVQMMDRQGRLDYYQLCENWASIFGRENLHVALYKPGLSIVDHFSSMLGIDVAGCSEESDVISNRSLPADAIGLMKVVSRLRHEDVPEAFCKELQKYVLRETLRTPKGDGTDSRRSTIWEPVARRALLDKYAERNRLLSRNYLQGEQFPDLTLDEMSADRVDENYISPEILKKVLKRLSGFR